MGASKNMLMDMRAEDFALIYSEDFSKSKATEAGKNLVDSLFDNGEVDELKVWSNIVRLKEVINSADKAFRDRISLNSKDISNGVEFSPKNGSKKLNYTEDPIYNELVSEVKSREELLKVAHNSKDVIFDNDGIEVPKVSASFDKSSITVKF